MSGWVQRKDSWFLDGWEIERFQFQEDGNWASRWAFCVWHCAPGGQRKPRGGPFATASEARKRVSDLTGGAIATGTLEHKPAPTRARPKQAPKPRKFAA